MSDIDYVAALKTVAGVVTLINPAAGTIANVILNLAQQATVAKATYDDAKRAWELIDGAQAGDVEQAELEAEVDALVARGLKPIERPGGG